MANRLSGDAARHTNILHSASLSDLKLRREDLNQKPTTAGDFQSMSAPVDQVRLLSFSMFDSHQMTFLRLVLICLTIHQSCFEKTLAVPKFRLSVDQLSIAVILQYRSKNHFSELCRGTDSKRPPRSTSRRR
jgi:hypothetical protein